MSDEPVLAFASAAEWEAWLHEHHADTPAVIVKMAKKASGLPTVTPAEAIEVALCFGWIDGVRRGLDDTHFLQRFTPRRARSKWSKINRAKAIELIESGRMRPAGLAEVERAKSDGRWAAAYDSHATITEPDDLRAALDANPAARAFFDALDRNNRYAILYRLHDAKRPETRQRRLEKFVAMCARGEKLYR
jgi:uncharacterized protein YdeI (YjbR/CyaY-like superfamily)